VGTQAPGTLTSTSLCQVLNRIGYNHMPNHIRNSTASQNTNTSRLELGGTPHNIERDPGQHYRQAQAVLDI